MAYFDKSRGLLDRQVFSSSEIYDREKATVFRRSWLFIGPEDWTATPGEFLTTTMGDTPVLLWRGEDDRRRLFLNICISSDQQVCSRERGQALRLDCPCHGWPYAPAGAPPGAPFGMVEVPRLESYGGLLFANFDPDATPLAQSMGDFAWYLDLLLDRREGGAEIYGDAAVRWSVDANWKLAADAFCGDVYRDLTLHKGLYEVTDARQFTSQGEGFQVDAGGGAMAVSELAEPLDANPVLKAYEAEAAREIHDRLGEGRETLRPLVGTLFPNLSVDGRTRSLHVWQPRGPLRTEVNTYCLVDRAAPVEVKDAMRRNCVFHFGPAGMQSQEDVGPWQSITKIAKTMLAERYPLNLQMGLGRERRTNLPGVIGDLFSETSQRAFYGWWQTQVEAEPAASPDSGVMRISG